MATIMYTVHNTLYSHVHVIHYKPQYHAIIHVFNVNLYKGGCEFRYIVIYVVAQLNPLSTTHRSHYSGKFNSSTPHCLISQLCYAIPHTHPHIHKHTKHKRAQAHTHNTHTHTHIYAHAHTHTQTAENTHINIMLTKFVSRIHIHIRINTFKSKYN